MNDNRGNGSSGFILGLIIGGAAVFLLGTDKGRKILKSLTEEGFGEFSQFIERAEEEIEDQDEVAVPKVRKARARLDDARQVIEEEFEEPISNGVKSNGHTYEPVIKRRFFRRTPKS